MKGVRGNTRVNQTGKALRHSNAPENEERAPFGGRGRSYSEERTIKKIMKYAALLVTNALKEQRGRTAVVPTGSRKEKKEMNKIKKKL